MSELEKKWNQDKQKLLDELNKEKHKVLEL
jgi:hypothetical protein